MQHPPPSTEPQIPDSIFPCFQVCRFSRGYSSAKSRFRFSEFPGPLRGDPKIQIPCFQCADSRILHSANSRFRVSEFPRFERPLCGSAEGPQFPNSLFPRGQIPGDSSANSRFQDSEYDVQIPGTYSRANSRFRVSEFPRPLSQGVFIIACPALYGCMAFAAAVRGCHGA